MFRLQVVIATRNRPAPLKECLISLNNQSLLPQDVVVVDSSDDSETSKLAHALLPTVLYTLHYIRTPIRSAARQRNLGAQQVESDLIFFLDDDVVLEPDFVREIVSVFETDADGKVGGVGGNIVNERFVEPRGINRLLLSLCLGEYRRAYGGRVIGPGVNFWPPDTSEPTIPVEWLRSGCSCFRKDLFMKHRFSEDFDGYSFAEDVHLSTRIARTHTLLTASRAKLFHHGLGASTHADWRALGASMVVNRARIMQEVLGKRRMVDFLRLFLYEVMYCPASMIASGREFKIIADLVIGKLAAFCRVLWSTGAHR